MNAATVSVAVCVQVNEEPVGAMGAAAVPEQEKNGSWESEQAMKKKMPTAA